MIGSSDNNETGLSVDGAKGKTASHLPQPVQPFLVAPTTGSEFNALQLDLVAVACLSLHDILFDFDSSVLHPDAADILKQLPALRQNHRGPTGKLPLLSIFGHADPVGEDEYNKQLSGRRARAVYGVLTQNVAMWDQLFQEEWSKTDVLGRMAVRLNVSKQQSRDSLFQQYMNALFPSPLAKGDFLGRGEDPNGKADFQGCGDFNPLVVLSTDENRTLAEADRNQANQVDRRVVIFLFCAELQIHPKLWPCPTATQATAGCRKRFFVGPPAGDVRRKPGPEHKEFVQTRDTFACRFYDRIARVSPCEDPKPVVGVSYVLIVVDELETPLVGVQVALTTAAGALVALTDASGVVRVDNAPPDGGQAALSSLQQLAKVMEGQEKKPFRKDPLPTGIGFVVRTPKQVLQPIALAPDVPMTLMIVTRTDVTMPWTNNEGFEQPQLVDGEGPQVLIPGAPAVLQLHSNGLGAVALVRGPRPQARQFAKIADVSSTRSVARGTPVPPFVQAALSPPAPAPPSDPADWLRVDIDALHQALFDKDSDAALAAIVTLHPDTAPEAEPDFPAPIDEGKIYFNVALASVERGDVDTEGDFSQALGDVV